MTTTTVTGKTEDVLRSEMEDRLPSYVTPYGISRILTKELGREIQGPSIYSKTKGQNPTLTSVKDDQGKWSVEKDEVIRFVLEYIFRSGTTRRGSGFTW